MEDQQQQPGTTPAPAPQEKKGRLQNALSAIVGPDKEQLISHPDEEPAEPEITLLEWRAPEFAYTKKPIGWFVVLGVFFTVLAVIAILTQQWLSIGLFAVMGIALAVYANREPRELEYEITNYGVKVGGKDYDFDKFRSYYELNDYGHKYIDLMPAKRFDLMVSLPVPPDLNEDIEDFMSQVLPKTETRNDAIDKLFRFLRF